MTFRDDILKYVKDKYDSEPEYLWRRFPDYVVFRHEDNRKWYALIMDVHRDKLGLQGKDRVDILNVKMSDPFLVSSQAHLRHRKRGQYHNTWDLQV